MKTMIGRGMRDIPSIQGNSSHSVSQTREQVVSELARLEHEKARLERELTIWTGNQVKTSGRLQRVEGRIALLQKALNPPPATVTSERPEGNCAAAQGSEGVRVESRGWREMKLGY